MDQLAVLAADGMVYCGAMSDVDGGAGTEQCCQGQSEPTAARAPEGASVWAKAVRACHRLGIAIGAIAAPKHQA